MKDNIRALLEQALAALESCATGGYEDIDVYFQKTYFQKTYRFSETLVADASEAIRAELAKPATPAWNDAPTCAGLWIQRSNLGSALEYVRPDDIGVQNWRGRWYGPIPQDKEGGAA